MGKEYLMIPGPTPIPEEVARAMSTEMFNHRGPRFKELIEQLTAELKKIFQTEGRLFILTASGTGGMEAAIVNFLSPGQRIISLTNGSFGERMAQIAEIYGVQVERLASEWGEPLPYDELEKRLREDARGEIKAITVVHNESSTGMMNDLALISRLRGSHPALLLVDTVSSMGAVDIPVDEWGIDVCFTGSQKALMLPPGLAIISVGERAWARMADSGMKRFYLNLATAQEFLDIGQTPFTPALSQMVAMKKSLELYFSEGRERCYARHRRMAGATRAAMRALGLELLVGEKEASLTVTAVKKPEEIDISRLRAVMREDFGVEIAGGQGKLQGKIFRLGHLGAVTEMDVIVAIAALEMALARLNYPVSLGQGVKAAQEVILAS
ncbi:MAG: alanine--glyoxylate aminotransferase family protein [Firmicutes bacterium]|nr:alanine--glyoxylate aminotransferase family protein [Bacillota bacterium]